ncbi:MAG: PEP-utilizing enzyme [Patescibacteria group bacterium]
MRSQKNNQDAKRYSLHFSNSGFNILTLDMIFNNNETYGEVDFIVLRENNITRAYLSPLSIKQCRYLGSRLLNDKFSASLIAKSKNLSVQLKNYKKPRLNSKNVLAEWKKSLRLNDKFCKLYRFYEPPFSQAVEAKLLKLTSRNALVKILSTHKINEITNGQVKKYVKRLGRMGEIKLQLHKDSETYVTDDSFTKYIAKKTKLSINLASAMRKEEVEKAITDEITVSTGELRKRLKGCVFIKKDGAWNLYTGNKFIYWQNKLRKIDNRKIRGDIAYPGLATGKVIIHLSWSGTTAVKKGNILVTSMTNPQMTPFLKNAGAIITDEGGITCHAAIISRELKKPCLVGTKNATQILKNGDLVQVNAYKGVAQIIKKSGRK